MRTVDKVLVNGATSEYVLCSNTNGYYIFDTLDGTVEPFLDIRSNRLGQYFHSKVEENISGGRSLCILTDTFFADTDDVALLLHEIRRN